MAPEVYPAKETSEIREPLEMEAEDLYCIFLKSVGTQNDKNMTKNS